MAYNNVTPPTLPSYDSTANPFYLIQFEYAEGAENWEIVRLRYSANPFTYDGAAITNAGEHHLQTWGTGTGEWTYWGTLTELSVIPGAMASGGYMRVYTNRDILDGTGAVWLAAGTVTPLEADPEAEQLIRIKSKLAGFIGAWCAPVRHFPKPTAEPVAFLYNGVRLPGLPVVPGFDKAFIRTWHQNSGSIRTDLYLFPNNAYYTVADGGLLHFGGGGAEPVQVMHYKLSENAWAFIDNPENALVPPPGGWVVTSNSVVYLTWANFDMEYDGTLYMKASDPVPVYE